MDNRLRQLVIDASQSKSIDDFYDAVLSALGAPDWHGRSLNALIDSILVGGINSVEPPYSIYIKRTELLDDSIVDYLKKAKFYLAKARAETYVEWDRNVDVVIEIAG